MSPSSMLIVFALDDCAELSCPTCCFFTSLESDRAFKKDKNYTDVHSRHHSHTTRQGPN